MSEQFVFFFVEILEEYLSLDLEQLRILLLSGNLVCMANTCDSNDIVARLIDINFVS